MTKGNILSIPEIEATDDYLNDVKQIVIASRQITYEAINTSSLGETG